MSHTDLDYTRSTPRRTPALIAECRRVREDIAAAVGPERASETTDEHVRGHALWRLRSRRRMASVDRLTARLVWGHYCAGPLAASWRTLAVAGPRGVLP